MFRSLELQSWRQYASIEVNFHDRLTILTGANGSGKTTLLHLLNRHWGWNSQLVSTPRFDKKGLRKYWTGFWDNDAELAERPQQRANEQRIGSIGYSSGQVANLWVPESVNEQYGVNIEGMQSEKGVYVPSHRSPYVFQRVEQIPTVLDAKEQIFQTYLNELMARFNTGGRTHSPSFRIKSSLISLATFGYGNQAVQRNDQAIALFEGFEAILRRILPTTLGFNRLLIRVPDVVLDTQTGEFSFDSVSGGVAAIIDLAWQIYMYLQLNEQFTVVIDEPETHLHPALQQRLLPDLLAAFPECQFVIATHNPFMVTSVPDAHVYVFSYNAQNRVESRLLDTVNMAGSTDEILRDVLGVPYTSPRWAREVLAELIAPFESEPLSTERFAQLKDKMRALGMDHLFPSTVARLVESKS